MVHSFSLCSHTKINYGSYERWAFGLFPLFAYYQQMLLWRFLSGDSSTHVLDISLENIPSCGTAESQSIFIIANSIRKCQAIFQRDCNSWYSYMQWERILLAPYLTNTWNSQTFSLLRAWKACDGTSVRL